MKSKNLLILLLVNGVIGQTFPIKNGFNIDGGNPVTEISIDATMVSNSDEALVSEKAIKTYVDGEVSRVTLDDVTTNGNTTTNSITTGNHVVNTSGVGTMTYTPGLDIRNSGTDSEALVSFSTGDPEYDVGKFWTGINQGLGYDIGYGSDFSSANTALRIDLNNKALLPNTEIGDITGNKDVTTKEYVDNATSDVGKFLNYSGDVGGAGYFTDKVFGGEGITFQTNVGTGVVNINSDVTDLNSALLGGNDAGGNDINNVGLLTTNDVNSNDNSAGLSLGGNSLWSLSSPFGTISATNSETYLGSHTGNMRINAHDEVELASNTGQTQFAVSDIGLTGNTAGSLRLNVGNTPSANFIYDGTELSFAGNLRIPTGAITEGLRVEDNNGNDALVVDGTTGDVTLPNSTVSDIRSEPTHITTVESVEGDLLYKENTGATTTTITSGIGFVHFSVSVTEYTDVGSDVSLGQYVVYVANTVNNVYKIIKNEIVPSGSITVTVNNGVITITADSGKSITRSRVIVDRNMTTADYTLQ